ncbi:MAG: restriction endonuclease subunit S [Saccharofermentans sp.]|nr:restriction endonuclease subunit S [Saccharofermentans sp.]
MEEKSKIAPELRFAGFTDDWEQRKLGEVFEQTSNLVNPNEHDIELWSLTVEDGLTPKSERYNREFLVKKEENFKEVRPGEIVYNPMNMTLGAVGFNGMNKSVAVSGYYTTMISKEDNDAYFINTWLKSPQALLLYKTYATGSLIEKQRVQFPTLSVIPTVFPSYSEQQKIGKCFEDIDDIITLHQRKYDGLQLLKKSMLQKLFPKDGETKPEIRFAGFTDAWEQRKFGELYIKNTEKNTDGSIGYDKTISVATMKYKDEGNGAATDSLTSYKVLRLGDIAFEGHTNKEYQYGRFVVNDIGVGLMSPRFSTLRPTSHMPISFWKYYIHSESVMRRILVNATKSGTMMNELVISELEKQIISVPSIEEQATIGSLLFNLDSVITLHQRKLEQLKTIKQFLLQKMFV